jgi:predicted nucleotidyltransferase
LKTLGLTEPLRAALAPLAAHIVLALVYGSVAKRADTALSDTDLLIVADELTLEQVYAAIRPAEREIARTIDVTLYTSEEFRKRREEGHPFITNVLSGEHWLLMGELDGSSAAR